MTDLATLVAERPALDVTADLTLIVDGTTVSVESYTDRLFLDVASVRALGNLVRATRGRSRCRRTADLLAAADLTAHVRIAGRTVALAGADADPGPLGRRFGDVELRLPGLLAATLRSPT